jgi:hypothetical protein
MLRVCIAVALISGAAAVAQVTYIVQGFRYPRYAGRHARWF